MLKHNKIQLLAHLGVALFFLLALSFKGSYNIAAFLLIALGLFYLGYHFIAKKQKWSLTSSDKAMIYSFAFYFVMFLISMWLHGGKGRELDNPSRAILVLPLILLFLQYPLCTRFLFHLLPISALIVGITALIQRFYLHWEKAFENQMHIQGGDIAMSLGLFSLISVFYFAIKKDYKLTALYFLFSLMGILASLLSTARGAWIGFPFIFVGILLVYRQYFSKKFFLTIGISVLTMISITVSLPQTQIVKRVQQAQADIHGYVEKNNGASSLGARFDMWKSALLMAQEKPILGWGEKGMIEKRQQQVKEKLVNPAIVQFNHSHNQFLDDLSKRGLLGLLALLAVLFVPLNYFRKALISQNIEIKTLGLLGTVHSISVIFYCLSQGFFTHNSGSIFYFLGTIIFYGLLRANLEKQHQCPN